MLYLLNRRIVTLKIRHNRVMQGNLTSSIFDSPSRSQGTMPELKIDAIKRSLHTARPAFLRALFFTGLTHKPIFIVFKQGWK